MSIQYLIISLEALNQFKHKQYRALTSNHFISCCSHSSKVPSQDLIKKKWPLWSSHSKQETLWWPFFHWQYTSKGDHCRNNKAGYRTCSSHPQVGQIIEKTLPPFDVVVVCSWQGVLILGRVECSGRNGHSDDQCFKYRILVIYRWAKLYIKYRILPNTERYIVIWH